MARVGGILPIMIHEEPFILHSQYRGCWCPNDARAMESAVITLTGHPGIFRFQPQQGKRIICSSCIIVFINITGYYHLYTLNYNLVAQSIRLRRRRYHYIMSTMASQVTSPTIVYSTVYSDTDQRKHQSSASLAFARGFHRWPVNSPHNNAENVSIWWRHHVCLASRFLQR